MKTLITIGLYVGGIAALVEIFRMARELWRAWK